eukprot:scaffold14996_cov20-Prasinocladus_malaysianus.AAC.1
MQCCQYPPACVHWKLHDETRKSQQEAETIISRYMSYTKASHNYWTLDRPASQSQAKKINCS